MSGTLVKKSFKLLCIYEIHSTELGLFHSIECQLCKQLALVAVSARPANKKSPVHKFFDRHPLKMTQPTEPLDQILIFFISRKSESHIKTSKSSNFIIEREVKYVEL